MTQDGLSIGSSAASTVKSVLFFRKEISSHSDVEIH